MSFKAIETQEQLNALLEEHGKNVRKEYEKYLSPEDAEKKYAEKYKGYLSPEQVELKYKDHLSPEKAAELNAKIKGHETNAVKMKIAHEMGMSYDAVGFLQGEDEESIKKSAETLKTLIGANTVAPLASTEPAMSNVQDAALRKTLNSLKGE